MSYTLKKNGNPLFTREGKHWWLTGFKLGEFSNPSELTMDITITLHNVIMRDAFVTGLWNAGYPLDEFTRNGTTVSFTFAKPYTPPPLTRIPKTDQLIQRKNELLCVNYYVKSIKLLLDHLILSKLKLKILRNKLLRCRKRFLG